MYIKLYIKINLNIAELIMKNIFIFLKHIWRQIQFMD